MTVQFIDHNRQEFGVEPVCAALQVAPSTYWTAKRRPLSARVLRDTQMMPLLLVLWQANYSVYGSRKLWIAARSRVSDVGLVWGSALTSALCQGTITSMSLIAADSLPVEPLDVLREVARSEAQLDELRWKQIAAARDAGASWAAIGEALGVSRQSAWEYFTRRVTTELAANVENSDLSEDEAMDSRS